MRLTKKLFYQGKQTRLLSTKLSWCPIKTNQTRLSSTSEFGLSCLLSTNFTVIFGCLGGLVCCQPISIIVIWMPPISWCILLSPSSPPYHHCCPMVVNSCQSMLQSIVVKFLHGYLLLAWSPILICCSHTQVSNRKQGMQIPFCNFPMQIPMQISNANFLCNSLFAISNAIVNANFQCKFLMQFPMQISNANFQCKFHLQFSLHFSMQSPLHTCLQNKYTGAARQRRGKSFASSRPARCIGGVLPSTTRPPLAQLQDVPV